MKPSKELVKRAAEHYRQHAVNPDCTLVESIAEFGERVARECADECDLLHQVHDGKRIARCGAMIRDKFGLPAKAVEGGSR